MRKTVIVILLLLVSLNLSCSKKTDDFSSEPESYDFGDFNSETLVAKAWESLSQNDLEAVWAYTNKCVEIYGDGAKSQQSTLKSYPKGTKEEIFSKWWALNDVATALYIQGEAYEKANMKELAKAAYQMIINEYSFGQCWDSKGWFWKPAEAAEKKLRKL